MKISINKLRLKFNQSEFRHSLLLGFLLFALSLLLNHWAANYADQMASSTVADIILSNTRAHDVDGILIFGPIILTLVVLYWLLLEPKHAPFVLKSLAAFVIIRAGFITLTHLGPVPVHLPAGSISILNRIVSGNDYFFSGHTGMPFLLALIYWQERGKRLICLGFSLVFAISVLLGHFHYSIDVFAAFFISHSIFHLTRKLWSFDYEAFQ